MDEMNNEIVKTKKFNFNKFRFNKKTGIIALIIILVLSLAGAGVYGIFNYMQNSGNYVAIVNGKKVTGKTYKYYLTYIKMYMEQMYQLQDPTMDMNKFWNEKIQDETGKAVSNMDYAKDACYKQAVSDAVKLEKAKAAGFVLVYEDNQKIDQQMNSQEYKSIFGKSGLSNNELLQIQKNLMIIQKFDTDQLAKITDVQAVAKLKEKNIEFNDEYYKKFQTYVTRHILKQTKSKEDPSKDIPDADKKKMYDEEVAIIARLNKGEDFAKIAQTASDDLQTGANGGIYEMQIDGNTDPAYSEAVSKLKIGQITQTPVLSNYGYHIIKLDSIKTLTDAEKITQKARAIEEEKRSMYDTIIQGWINSAKVLKNDLVINRTAF